eukprot:2558586-Rhodomonas_salina.1
MGEPPCSTELFPGRFPTEASPLHDSFGSLDRRPPLLGHCRVQGCHVKRFQVTVGERSGSLTGPGYAHRVGIPRAISPLIETTCGSLSQSVKSVRQPHKIRFRIFLVPRVPRVPGTQVCTTRVPGARVMHPSRPP